MDGLTGSSVWGIVDTLAPKGSKQPTESTGTITRIDADGAIWVTPDGGETEMPIRGSYSEGSIGDVVKVSVNGGHAMIVGNSTAPSVGSAYVRESIAPVASKVQVVSIAAGIAQSVADAAKAVADAINQHFWHDSEGAHVTQVTEEEWSTQGGASYQSGPNSLWNSLGMLFRNGTNNLLAIVTGSNPGVAIYDGEDNEAGNVTASFTGDGVVLGKSGETHAEIDYHSLQLIDKEGTAYFHVNDLRDEDGYAYVTETYPPNFQAYTYNIACPVVAPQGVDNPVSVKVDGTDVSPVSYQNDDSNPFYAGYVYADTSSATASSVISVSYWTTSQAAKTYTAGIRDGNTGAGVMSFASGYEVAASAPYSVALNFCTKAVSRWQTVLGRFNAIDQRDRYALIIGNGVSDAGRSNALALQWDGTMELAKALPTASGGTGSTGYGTYLTEDVSTAISTTSGAWAELASIELTAGTWIVHYNAMFASNATGRRNMVLHTASAASSTGTLRTGGVTANATSGAQTILSATRIVQPTSTTTYYVNVLQASGNSLNVTGFVQAFRLK